jgi:hypothetical protein
MKIVVLDGYTENPGDLSWDEMKKYGELTVYDRTPAEEVVNRIGNAEVVFTNKTPITKETMDACPDFKFISVLATGYNVIDVNYAKEHLPEEACGLLAGAETEEGREIKKVYFLENKDHAEDHFTLDPRDQMNAIKDMRANGLKPLGNWHSHPSSPYPKFLLQFFYLLSSPSRPSVEDIRLAFDSKASYLILSLIADYPVLNSFHIENGEWTKEDLRIYSEEYYF